MKVAGEAPTWPFPTLQHLTHSLSDVSFLMELSVLKKLLLVPLSQHAEDNEISGAGRRYRAQSPCFPSRRAFSLPRPQESSPLKAERLQAPQGAPSIHTPQISLR